tara:strand:- start:2508 stop:2747 length:240 start_codon:yes stop_codon:yes gene_type:complete
MQFILTFIFLSLLTIFLYGFFTYYNKKKHLSNCNVIYILDDGFDDSSSPDFFKARSNELYNLDIKRENRLNKNLDIFWE